MGRRPWRAKAKDHTAMALRILLLLLVLLAPALSAAPAAAEDDDCLAGVDPAMAQEKKLVLIADCEWKTKVSELARSCFFRTEQHDSELAQTIKAGLRPMDPANAAQLVECVQKQKRLEQLWLIRPGPDFACARAKIGLLTLLDQGIGPLNIRAQQALALCREQQAAAAAAQTQEAQAEQERRQSARQALIAKFKVDFAKPRTVQDAMRDIREQCVSKADVECATICADSLERVRDLHFDATGSLYIPPTALQPALAERLAPLFGRCADAPKPPAPAAAAAAAAAPTPGRGKKPAEAAH